ncbi:hypothetical protein LTS02_003588 [Friedmanniomyces endolithicus]|nr:hypothetical protein LTS02_003588 [Friedmanniomyces endolithicus]
MDPVRQDAALRGTFTVPIDDEVQSDPWTREYYAPPWPEKTVKVSFPLLSFRETVFGSQNEAIDNASAQRFLHDNGFTAIKHRSALHSHPSGTSIFQDQHAMDTIYCPEIALLVQRLTGCKKAFTVTHRVRGVSASTNAANVAKPLRIPHNDTTPLGTRQAIRYSRHDLRDAAEEAGILAVEQALYESTHGVKAVDKESQAFEELYNFPVPGPRYATYTVWRPLKLVTRDPLVMVPRREIETDPDLVLWRYDNRVPGPDGDWLRQLEMVKIGKETVALRGPLDGDQVIEAAGPTWRYLPDQQPDEVLVVQLSDTASLGPDATVGGGTAHASPDLGDAGYGDARESVEVRVIAIW